MPWFICDYRDWQIKVRRAGKSWEAAVSDKSGKVVKRYVFSSSLAEDTTLKLTEEKFREGYRPGEAGRTDSNRGDWESEGRMLYGKR